DPQQCNRYAYARNNPLSFVDPLGLAFQCVSGEQLVYVDVESGAGGGRRDSVPILWNYVTCAEYGETTPDPLNPSPPTGPGVQNPGSSGGSSGSRGGPSDGGGGDSGGDAGPQGSDGDDGRCQASGWGRFFTPDYLLFQGSFGPGWGPAISVSVDRFGGTYLGLGLGVGKSVPVGLSAAAGKMKATRDWWAPLTPSDATEFLSGAAINAGAGYKIGGGVTVPLSSGELGLE